MKELVCNILKEKLKAKLGRELTGEDELKLLVIASIYATSFDSELSEEIGEFVSLMDNK